MGELGIRTSQGNWYNPVTPALGGPKQENGEIKASLHYIDKTIIIISNKNRPVGSGASL